MKPWMLVAVGLSIALIARTASAAPSCTTPAACAASCRDGVGDLMACTQYAEALLHGRDVEPDRPKALRLLTTACGIDGDERPSNDPIDPAACLSLGNLRQRGWLFEIEQSDDYREAFMRAADRARCFDSDTIGCGTRARAWLALANASPPSEAGGIQASIKLAIQASELGCRQDHRVDACLIAREVAFRSADAAERTRITDIANAGIVTACTVDDSVEACTAIYDRAQATAVRASLERICTKGDHRACSKLRYDDVLAAMRDPAALRAAVTAFVAICDDEGTDTCSAIAVDLINGRVGAGLPADPQAGIALAERRCAVGDQVGCQVAARERATGPDAIRDLAKSRAAADRSCRLASYNQFCVCDDPTIPSCIVRSIYGDDQACRRGEVGACVRVATHFRDGDGIGLDVNRAANYLHRGCDAADKTACAMLDEVCRANPELPVDMCQQSLIQSDLFFEAEFQAAAGGDIDLVNPDATAPHSNANPNAVTVGDVAASLPTSARRGKLDADLVVDIVLDRARQAAIKLVVSELLRAQHRTGYRYLQDLLDQGARLLADPTTLRREKFEDLGMTVVRAFVASNLIDGLYPGTNELRAAPEIGATVVAGATLFHTPAIQPLPAEMHGYLVDVAYYWLGQTQLFGRSSSQTLEPPVCPWTQPEGQTLCTQLAERATAERAIGVAKVLDALRLVKLLRSGGFEDVRRLIEAASQSRTIASLKTTPGLSLQSWQDQIVNDSRDRVAKMRSGLSDVRTLLRSSIYADRGLSLDDLIVASASARLALAPSAVRLSIGTNNIEHLMRILRIIDSAKYELGRQTATPVPGTPPPPAGALDPRTLITAKVRKGILDGLQEWGMRSVTEVGTKLETLSASVETLPLAIDHLDTAIANVRALFARFPGPDRKVTLDVGDLPLYASVDLTHELRAAAAALAEVDDGLRTVFPGEVPARLRFARTSVARLIAFLDLMERVARQSPLTMRSGDVIGALRTLGTTHVDGFDAPLYDVLEPVLDAIKTHEPMSLELLFAVIGRVRLDTLIGSLQGRSNACSNDTSVDCWVTKLIHALQESIERDGSNIRVDGGKFAQRLAQHGDDFRHKHTWRGYFHLTVGVGGLYSDPANDSGSLRRPTPLIAEQVGFGLASPSMLGDRLTFKIGAAASGILYRALLDSEESNAIMLHPILLALDVGDLVEAYVSPAMIMLYPADATHDGAVRWGFSAGLSVPLSAYLERL